jgi:CheY-like chemotaxis protein
MRPAANPHPVHAELRSPLTWGYYGAFTMKTVLFVDDSRDICEVIEAMCQSLPEVECVCVTSMSAVQERAAEVLRTSLPILDVNLGPGKPSGVELPHGRP